MALDRPTLRKFIEIQYQQAIAGLEAETEGIPKLAKAEAIEKSVRDKLGRSRLGACHREELAVLSLDVRGSSKIAQEHKREDVFIAFHCLLPTSAFVIQRTGGELAGLRGDGVLGVIGIGVKSIPDIVTSAYETGMMLIEAVTEVMNPFLGSKEIPIEFVVGVGLDFGWVTMTKIGYQSDFEVTAYGDPVNVAAKNSRGTNSLWMSARARSHRDGVNEEGSFAPKKQRLPDVL